MVRSTAIALTFMAVCVSAPVAAQEADLKERKRLVLLSEMAFHYGRCEEHFSRETADEVLRAMTGASLAEKTEGQSQRIALFASMYSQGRDDGRASRPTGESCLTIITDTQADLAALDGRK